MKNKTMKNKIDHYKKIYFAIALLANVFLAKLAYAQWDANNLTGFGLPNASIYSIISNILNWLLAIVGVVGIIGFVISGILYLTAAGNEDMIQKAKRAMTYSIIGVIVALSGLVAIYFADSMLNAVFF